MNNDKALNQNSPKNYVEGQEMSSDAPRSRVSTRENWKRVRLGEAAALICDGDWIESKDQSPLGIRLIQTGNIGNGVFLEKASRAKFISDETFLRLKCTEVFEQDVLISRLPDPVGRSCLVPSNLGKSITAVDCSIFRPKKNVCLPKYFVHFSNSKFYAHQISKFLAGSTRIRISRKNLESIEIPLPPLEEQRRIAGTLDKVRELIELRERELAKFDELVKCRFVEMFGDPVTNPKGWEEETLGTTCEVVSGATPKTEKEEYWNGENFWITPAELSDEDFIITKTERTLSDLGVRSSSLKLLPIGTVLLSSRAPIGKLAIVGTPMYCNQGFKNLICGPRLKTIFLWAFLRERKKYLISLGRGATFKEISKSIVESIPIPVPPLSLQAEFARFVEAVDKSKFAVRQSLEKLNVCYKSLMQEYFG